MGEGLWLSLLHSWRRADLTPPPLGSAKPASDQELGAQDDMSAAEIADRLDVVFLLSLSPGEPAASKHGKTKQTCVIIIVRCSDLSTASHV